MLSAMQRQKIRSVVCQIKRQSCATKERGAGRHRYRYGAQQRDLVKRRQADVLCLSWLHTENWKRAGCLYRQNGNR